MTSTIYFRLARGDEALFNAVTANGFSAVDIAASSTSSTHSGIITPSAVCAPAVNLSAGGTFTLFSDTNFRTVLDSTTTTGEWVTLNVALDANVSYGYLFQAELAPTEGDVLVSLQAKTPLVVSSWFPNGFINVLQLGATASLATNSDGSFTYTFLNYPVNSGVPIALMQTGSSIQSGTMLITSTVGAFANQTEAFTAPAGYLGFLVPTTTGNVSGTVNVTVDGAGTTVFANSFYTSVS